MTNLVNLGEYGQPLRFNVNEDISAATITLILSPSNGTAISKAAADGVVVPGSDVVLLDGSTYLANEYAQYTVEAGLFDSPRGTWNIRLVADWGTKLLKTEWLKFTVNP